MRCLLICMCWCVLALENAVFAEVRIVSWNISNFHSVLNESLRDGAPIRNSSDLSALIKMRQAIAGDVFALQEINGPDAARLIFPAAEFDLCVSSRYDDDKRRGWDQLGSAGPNGRLTDRIYTIIAIKRGAFSFVNCQTYPDIGVVHYEGRGMPREVRRGVAARLKWDDKDLTVLNIHLKSSCHDRSLEPIDGENTNPSCATIERQINSLEAWVDDKIAQGLGVLIAGDFNRRMNKHFGGADTERREHLWADLNDAKPEGAAFHAFPPKVAAVPPERLCWGHQNTVRDGLYRPEPIDFLMFDNRAFAQVLPATFREWDYKVTLGAEFDDIRYTGKAGEHLSDHCPISINLR